MMKLLGLLECLGDGDSFERGEEIDKDGCPGTTYISHFEPLDQVKVMWSTVAALS